MSLKRLMSDSRLADHGVAPPAARIKCPLCPWTYDVPPLTDQQRDPMLLAAVFGPGVMSQVALSQNARETEALLAQHLDTHTLVEWVRKVTELEREVARLTPANPNQFVTGRWP